MEKKRKNAGAIEVAWVRGEEEEEEMAFFFFLSVKNSGISR